jgi:hypothetical protein
MDDLCQDFDQCEKWMGCFGVQGDTAASCHKFCIDDASCPDGRTCSVNVDFGGGVTAVVCSDAASSCNPFLASASECGVGNGCYLTSTGTKCMAAGNLGLGQDCYGQGPNTCQAGLQCLVECTNICNTNAANPLPPVCEQTCGTSFLTIDYPNSIGVCVTETVPQTCNLFTQTGCPAGEACYAVTGGWACAEEGFKEPGAACVYTNDCAAGSLCVSSVCRKACDLGLGAVAPSACGSACGGTWTLLAPQAWDVGVCAVP